MTDIENVISFVRKGQDAQRAVNELIEGPKHARRYPKHRLPRAPRTLGKYAECAGTHCAEHTDPDGAA